jgi:thymidylate synthase ThyX
VFDTARAGNLGGPMQYVAEPFTSDEQDILRPYFTNVDGPVFALVNLPEVVKGALFARYSRSDKSLRRLFLDEFVGTLDISGDLSIDASVGLKRAEELYDRVFLEYGDDSVAQLGGVHLACEQASNLLTKVLEWGRLMAYLEQSTRYIAYDTRTGGRFRYYRDPEMLRSSLGTRYVGDMDRMFDTYAGLLPVLGDHFRARYPKTGADSDFVYRQAIRAKAFDSLRGILPAAALSNVGIYGTGQGYEQLLMRMRAHPLPEARAYADLMLTELRKVIPSFLKRVDRPDRGGAWSDYLGSTRDAMGSVAERLFPPGSIEPDPSPTVRLVDFDPGQPSPQAGAGPGAHRVPVRRPGRLRRLPGPPAPPHAHRRVAAAVAGPRLRPA